MDNSQSYEIEDRALLFRQVDAKTDKFQIKLEQDIEKLPESLQFIKSYIYFDFLPKLDQNIDCLEKVKTTPNYDNHLVKIRPLSIRSQTNYISCFDLLQNHNIKHPKISKMIYGTFTGSLHIYDIENDKNLPVSQQISQSNNRIDSLSTATIKYYDSYITRIACNCRSEVLIYIISFNHSFSLMNFEFCINTVDPSVNDPVLNEKISLEYLVSYMKFSKDAFYLGVADYAGGVRLFKFHELPVGKNQSVQNTENDADENNNKEKNDAKDKNKKKNDKEKTEGVENKKIEIKNDFTKFTYINRFCADIRENFTILPNETGNASEANNNQKDNKKDAKKDAKKPNPKDAKKKDKGDKVEEEEPGKIDESMYNIKSEYDELEINGEKIKCDVSLYQVNGKKHCVNIHFIPKNFIFEEKYNAGYSSSTITIGAYVAFANSTNFKYISLYPYLTDNMKKLFKVVKGKTGAALSAEDNITLNSQMVKKEREFLNFIRTKLDPNNPNYQGDKPLSDPVPAKDVKKDDKKDAKKDKPDPKKDKVDPKADPNAGAPQSKYVPISPMNPVDITKKEITFNTFFSISCMTGQKNLNKINNLLAIGMVDGSVLVWDCELHTDKFLFQKSSRYEITTLTLDENYLFVGSKEGLVYIYDLLHGNEIFTCSHNPYDYFPVSCSLPFFYFCVLCVDFSNKICIYNMKESNKIGNLMLNDIDNPIMNYEVCYFNNYQIQFNDEFVVMLCNKKENSENVVNLLDKFSYSLIDLINYEDKKKDYVRKKPDINETEFYNEKILMENGLRIYEKYGYKNEMRKEKELNEKRNQIAELEKERSIYENTIKLNLSKIKSLKEAAESEIQKTVESNVSKRGKPAMKKAKKKVDKKGKKDKKESAPEEGDLLKAEENQKLEENNQLQEKIKQINEKIAEINKDTFVPPEKITLADNNYFLVFRIRDLLFKCYPNLVYAYKKGYSLKKILRKYTSEEFPTFTDMVDKKDSISPTKLNMNEIAQKNAENVRNELLANVKQKSSASINSEDRDRAENKGSKQNLKVINTEECVSTQQKDVLYNSFKNIKERYSYKDQRSNNIQIRNEKIVKELKKKKK